MKRRRFGDVASSSHLKSFLYTLSWHAIKHAPSIVSFLSPVGYSGADRTVFLILKFVAHFFWVLCSTGCLEVSRIHFYNRLFHSNSVNQHALTFYTLPDFLCSHKHLYTFLY